MSSEVDVDQLAQRRIRLPPGPRARLHEQAAAAQGPGPKATMRTMLRWLRHQQTARGRELRNLRGSPHEARQWHELPSSWLRWEDVLSVPWRSQTDHIGVCEGRARALTWAWRLREPSQHNKVCLHLLDSQCNLSAAAKGRTGSRRLGHNLRKSAALLLACNCRELAGYTSSAMSPADAASCDKRRWGRFRAQEAKTERAAKRARRAGASPPPRTPPAPP